MHFMNYRETICCIIVFSRACRRVSALMFGAPPPLPSFLSLTFAMLPFSTCPPFHLFFRLQGKILLLVSTIANKFHEFKDFCWALQHWEVDFVQVPCRRTARRAPRCRPPWHWKGESAGASPALLPAAELAERGQAGTDCAEMAADTAAAGACSGSGQEKPPVLAVPSCLQRGELEAARPANSTAGVPRWRRPRGCSRRQAGPATSPPLRKTARGLDFFLKYVITEALPASLIVLAACLFSEPVRVWLCQAQRKLLAASHRKSLLWLAPSLLTKNYAMQNQHSKLILQASKGEKSGKDY